MGVAIFCDNCGSSVTVKPRKDRSHGCATALFCALTLRANLDGAALQNVIDWKLGY